MELFILYFNGLPIKILRKMMNDVSLKIVFIFANGIIWDISSGSSLFAKVPVYQCPPVSRMKRVNLCTWETPKRVLLQTVKTPMKCRIMRHFIRVYTVCKGKKDL